MTEYPQQHSLLLSGADDELVRLGSYGSVSQDHAIQVVPEEKPHSETVPGAGAATREFPWLQTTLIFSALVGLALVVLVFAHDTDPWHDFLSRGKKVVLIDLSVAFVFFAASDVIAQIIPVINQRNGRGDSRRLLRHHEAISYTRAARCGVLGVFMNGFGYWAWVHALNILIPQQDVDSNVDDLQAFGLLIGKSLLDSCLWGTTANTVGILGRRMLEGDSLSHALDVWADKILSVTACELRFWPFWSASQFLLVPNSFQVVYASLGSLMWNAFISYTALQEPVDHSHVRIGIKVDGVSSPVHRSPVRKYVQRGTQSQASPLHRPGMSPSALPDFDLSLADDLVDAAETMANGRRTSRSTLLWPSGRATAPANS